MQAVPFTVLGITRGDMASMYFGLSALVGLLSIGYGVVNLLACRLAPAANVAAGVAAAPPTTVDPRHSSAIVRISCSPASDPRSNHQHGPWIVSRPRRSHRWPEFQTMSTAARSWPVAWRGSPCRGGRRRARRSWMAPP
jgi:hypothetical protein